MKIKQFSRNAAVVLAIIIGLYPLLYLSADIRTHGLLQTKPTALVDDTWWSIAFFIHITSGGIALLCGWPQFNAKRRSRHMQLHRISGRIYMVAVALSGLTGLYVAFFATGGLVCAYGFSTLALLWVFTDVMAYVTIRRLEVAQHRRWVILNYSLTFAAVTLRLWMPLLIGVAGMDFIAAYRIIAWLCWVPNLLTAWWVARPKSIKPVLQTA